jgi:hypothetical protein
MLTSWLRASSNIWPHSIAGQFNIANSIEPTGSLFVE